MPEDRAGRCARLHGDPAAAEEEARALGESGREVVAVSACLLGEPTRYDGRDKRSLAALARLGDVEVLPLCPELLGGMGCPREPCAYASGDGRDLLAASALVRDRAGRDVSAAMRAGAERAAHLARLAGARRAILKQRSPSCGTRDVHRLTGDARFSAPGPGVGVAAAALAAAGLALEDEDGT